MSEEIENVVTPEVTEQVVEVTPEVTPENVEAIAHTPEEPEFVPPTPATNAHIVELVSMFRDRLNVTQEEINAYTVSKNIEPITVGELDDHIYQVKYDERMAKVYPTVLNLIAQIKYYPEYSSQEDIDKKIKELNDIEDKIVEALIELEIPYRLINTTMQDIAGYVEKMIGNSKTRLSNMSVRVMMSVTEKTFGNKEFTVKDASDYLTALKKK